jgi:hypothetical protein
MRRKYFVEAHNSLHETVGAVDLAARLDDDDAVVAATCTCFADAAISNVRLGREPTPTEADITACRAYGATHPTGPSRFAVGLPFSVTSIAATYANCLDASKDFPFTFQAVACVCGTDAALHDDHAPENLAADENRCLLVARYHQETGHFPTQRQFDVLRGVRSRDVSSGRSDTEPVSKTPSFGAKRSSGPFIDYAGNGSGPTPCSDGMWSNSGGRGTCASHGGTAGHRKHQ